MRISIRDLRDLSSAPDADAVVVIDVLRAFSTAAVALNRGAPEIYPVLDVAEAFARRERDPDLVLMGETDCRPIPGFDLGNSPVDAAAFAFQGRRAVQRTTAGTRGLVTCAAAPSLWASSFLVASATVAAIIATGAKSTAFVITGTVHYGSADEDLACAEWMSALFRGERPPAELFLQRVRGSVAASTFLDPASPLHAPADVDFCARADVFSFAMKAVSESGRLTLRSVPVTQL
ncbi:MAG: 2-phosphosulfolactate phosphatase [Verrucomicrobiaceae bacterium]|nr:MAG: 2-phosphosulfolactate phosphatase [Verrucomicrobiaceae bacterium]